MRRWRRARERGAVYVEATIVIVFFVLMFLGVVFFRDLYQKQLHAQRLARAGALAQAMSACEQDAAGYLRGDTVLQASSGPTDNSDVRFPGPGDEGGEATDSRASEIFRSMPQGKEGLPGIEVATLTLSGEAKVTTRRGELAEEEGFRGTAASTSYAMCADGISNAQYGGLVDYVTQAFDSIF